MRQGIGPPEAEQLAVAGERELRKVLRGLELRVSGEDPLLPGDLVQVAVVEHEHDEPRVAPAGVVVSDVDQLVDAVHLHRAVAGAGDDRPVGMGELRRDCIGHGWTHRGQRAREHGQHALAQLQYRAHQLVDEPESPVRCSCQTGARSARGRPAAG